MPPAEPPSARGVRFEHAALVFDDDEALRQRLLPAVEDWLSAGEQVRIVVTPPTERVLRRALDGHADAVGWSSPDAFFHQRLGVVFESFRGYLAELCGTGRPGHLVAEPDLLVSADDAVDRVAAYLSFEAAVNDVFAAFDCSVICLYDARRHPTLVVEDVRSLHGYELRATGLVVNPAYLDAHAYLGGRHAIAPDPPPAEAELALELVEATDLRRLRERLRPWAARHGFARDPVEAVVVAVTEVATNGLVHGAPPVVVRGWRQGRVLVVQVDDAGGAPLPPLAGYRPPGDDEGHGMWIARQLADVLTVSSAPGRTTVRLYFPQQLT